jgi:hypothetical protein
MSGEIRSTLGAPVFQTSIRCGSGPPLGYSPGALPVRFRATLTYIGSG